MGRGNETFGKKELRAKKDKKRKEKEQKRQKRKQNVRDGNNLDEMIAYVDEYGKISSTPPDLTQKREINIEEIEVSVRKTIPDANEIIRKGIVTFFNDSKGFGFIKDSLTKQDVFVHINALIEPIKENERVTFEIVKGPRGLNAINVKADKE
jgi:cold shock CspA family protein